MTPLDLLYYTLSVGIIIFVGIGVFLAYNIFMTLREIRLLIAQGRTITQTFTQVKDSVNIKAAGSILGTIVAFVGGKAFDSIASHLPGGKRPKQETKSFS